MDVSAYDYGAVIAYNTARTPGLGSAIFLHINIGMPRALRQGGVGIVDEAVIGEGFRDFPSMVRGGQ